MATPSSWKMPRAPTTPKRRRHFIDRKKRLGELRARRRRLMQGPIAERNDRMLIVEERQNKKVKAMRTKMRGELEYSRMLQSEARQKHEDVLRILAEDKGRLQEFIIRVTGAKKALRVAEEELHLGEQAAIEVRETFASLGSSFAYEVAHTMAEDEHQRRELFNLRLKAKGDLASVKAKVEQDEMMLKSMEDEIARARQVASKKRQALRKRQASLQACLAGIKDCRTAFFEEKEQFVAVRDMAGERLAALRRVQELRESDIALVGAEREAYVAVCRTHALSLRESVDAVRADIESLDEQIQAMQGTMLPSPLRREELLSEIYHCEELRRVKLEQVSQLEKKLAAVESESEAVEALLQLWLDREHGAAQALCKEAEAAENDEKSAVERVKESMEALAHLVLAAKSMRGSGGEVAPASPATGTQTTGTPATANPTLGNIEAGEDYISKSIEVVEKSVTEELNELEKSLHILERDDTPESESEKEEAAVQARDRVRKGRAEMASLQLLIKKRTSMAKALSMKAEKRAATLRRRVEEKCASSTDPSSMSTAILDLCNSSQRALLDHIDKGLTMHAARKEMEDLKAKLEDLKVEVSRHRKEEQAAKRILQERIDAEEAISAAISRMEEGWKSEVEALKVDIKEKSSHLDEQLKKLDTDIQVAKRDLQGLGRRSVSGVQVQSKSRSRSRSQSRSRAQVSPQTREEKVRQELSSASKVVASAPSPPYIYPSPSLPAPPTRKDSRRGALIERKTQDESSKQSIGLHQQELQELIKPKFLAQLDFMIGGSTVFRLDGIGMSSKLRICLSADYGRLNFYKMGRNFAESFLRITNCRRIHREGFKQSSAVGKVFAVRILKSKGGSVRLGFEKERDLFMWLHGITSIVRAMKGSKHREDGLKMLRRAVDDAR
eukprot:g4903.t1